MKTTEILSFLPFLFKTSDVKKLEPHADIFLHRAKQRGYIERIIRGTYLNVFKCQVADTFPGVEEVACFVHSPCYITAEWAINYHGVLLQSPKVCTVVTTRPKRKNRFLYRGYVIEYSTLKRELFFGFQYEPTLKANLAGAEKALLDLIYLRGKRIPVFDELELDLLDKTLLQKMASKFPPYVARYCDQVLSV